MLLLLYCVDSIATAAAVVAPRIANERPPPVVAISGCSAFIYYLIFKQQQQRDRVGERNRVPCSVYTVTICHFRGSKLLVLYSSLYF